MYNTDLVRKLCGEIAGEKDPEKAQELMSLLQAVMKDDQEDMRIRVEWPSSLKSTRLSAIPKPRTNPFPTFQNRPLRKLWRSVNSCRS